MAEEVLNLQLVSVQVDETDEVVRKKSWHYIQRQQKKFYPTMRKC